MVTPVPIIMKNLACERETLNQIPKICHSQFFAGSVIFIFINFWHHQIKTTIAAHLYIIVLFGVNHSYPVDGVN
jgi:hypothetical protein